MSTFVDFLIAFLPPLCFILFFCMVYLFRSKCCNGDKEKTRSIGDIETGGRGTLDGNVVVLGAAVGGCGCGGGGGGGGGCGGGGGGGCGGGGGGGC